MKYKIAGLSITSRQITMSVATLKNPIFPETIPDIIFEKINRVYIEKLVETSNPTEVIDVLMEAAFRDFPQIMYLGVGCYGPFTDWEKIRVSPTYELVCYTKLGKTTGSRALSEINLKILIQNCIKKHTQKKIKICVQTDVAVDAIGYIKQFSSHLFVQERTTALIRADYGVGGTFMHMSDKNAWHGVSHTEVGQINVQQWINEDSLRDQIGVYQLAANPHSVEGLASIPAIEHYYQASFETLKIQINHEAWDREAWYLAQLAWAFSCFVAPSNILFCGITMTVPGLLDKIRDEFEKITKTTDVIPFHAEMAESKYIDDFLAREYADEGYTQVKDTSIEGTLCLAAMLSASSSK